MNSAVLAWLGAITAAAAALRFASLGVQSYHHDEVVTAMRVLPGSFADMLHAVRVSESNPPLYYVLAWPWAHLFGRGEVGLRSLSALFGTLTVPVGYLIGRALSGRRTGIVLAAILAFNPMLIWYSQEARSYALLVLCAAVSMLFFLRALQTRGGRDLSLWALASAAALWSHYFAIFIVAIEAAWLLVALRRRWRLVVPSVAAVVVAGGVLLPLLAAQVNPDHIGWIESSPLGYRFWETGVSFLAGETGHVIAEPPRELYGLAPAILVAVAVVLLAVLGTHREHRAALVCLALGLSVPVGAALAALVGKDFVLERNLLPALVPLAAIVALGLATARARPLGPLLAVALCAYWAAFAVYVTQTPNLQRPDFRSLAGSLGQPATRRAVVSWRLAAEPLRWYLSGGAVRMYGGAERVGEVDLIAKRRAASIPVSLPRSFHMIQRIRLDRLTLLRFVARRPQRVEFHTLRSLSTGFGAVGVVLDGPRAR
ncbi:MAG TPA: glycosyltransferase family 39 protein [Solirubrobacterales bacterium]|nr:glycosyltransferase family 39 protein [Solirubrobacterales bacterium]